MLCLILISSILSTSDNAKILSVSYNPSASQQSVYNSIVSRLSLQGHQVTSLTPRPLNNTNLTNLTQIDVSDLYAKHLKNHYRPHLMAKNNMLISTYWQIMDLLEKYIELVLQKSIYVFGNNKSIGFDLILIENYHPLVYAIGCRFKAPMIGMGSTGALLFVHDSIGNPTHPIVHPDILSNLVEKESFYEDILKVLFYVWNKWFYYWYLLPRSDKIARSYFPKCDYLGNLVNNISLVLTTTNPLLHAIRPNVPTLIELRKTHLGPQTALPLDLQKYLDSSVHGVVYFSLGSNVQSSKLPEVTKHLIVTVLSELPYNILFKWETDDVPSNAKNILFMKWFPQQDVLAHKNVKVFVSQIGLQSLEEAITFEVPLVGLPFMSDQMLHGVRVEELGIGLKLDVDLMTKQDLKNAILNVAQNDRYKKNIQKLRKLYDDEPMTGLEKAIWWIEYVVRHKGASHLRSPVVDLPWYKYYLLDVITAIIVFLTVVVCVVYALLKFLIKLYCNNRFKKFKQQ